MIYNYLILESVLKRMWEGCEKSGKPENGFQARQLLTGILTGFQQEKGT